MPLNIHTRNYILFCLLLSAMLTISCSNPYENIPEPNYIPQLIHLGQPIKTEGKRIPAHLIAAPDTMQVQEIYIGPAELQYTAEETGYQPAGEPEFTPSQAKSVDMSLVTPPVFVPALPEKTPMNWPRQEEAQMALVSGSDQTLYQLDIQRGLRSNMIRHIFEDSKGRIWISTHGGGASVWDGQGLTHFTQREGLAENEIKCVLEDSKGHFWIGTNGGGISIWDGEQLTLLTTEQGLADDFIYDLLEDRQGRIWIATYQNGISIWDGGRLAHLTTEQGLSGNFVYDLLEDRQGRIWIATPGYGLSIWDGKGFSHFTTRQGLSSDAVLGLMEGREGHIWIATGDGGVNIWNGQGFVHYSQEQGLSSDAIICFLEDNEGRVWIGTYDNGIDIWDGKGFTHLGTGNGLAHEHVWRMLQDRSGRVWIGTNGGGAHIWNKRGFTQKAIRQALIWALLEDRRGQLWAGAGDGITVRDGNSIAAAPFGQFLARHILEDSKGRFWIGTEGDGLKIWDGRKLVQASTEQGLPFESAYCLLESRKGHIWAGTENGAFCWDGQQLYHYTTEQGLSDNSVLSILEDSRGRFWFGTDHGVTIWDGQGFTHLTTEHGLVPDYAWSFAEDQYGRIWMATLGGGIYIRDGNNLYQITTEQGLSHGHVLRLSLDEGGNIWAGTFNGITCFRPQENPSSLAVKVYASSEGLSGSPVASILAGRQGYLWTGSSSLNYSRLSQLELDTARPHLYIYDLEPFFYKMDWRQAKDSLEAGAGLQLSNPPLSLKGVRFDSVQPFTNLPARPIFPYHFNQLTLSWAAPHPTAHQLRFSYLLEGQDRNWSPLIKENKATFTGLRPGRYHFKVRAVAGNGRWSKTAAYSFTIRPPWWATWWAYALYILMAGGTITGLYRFQLSRRLARAEAQRLQELDEFKTRMYTNISHEFRTPLAVILGMADKMGKEPENWFRQGIDMIRRNGHRLLHLVNQMLDLRKVESGSMPVHLRQGNVLPFLEQIAETFAAHAEPKDVRLHFLAGEPEIIMDFDPDKLNKIVSNLLSNAVKFTPPGGNVYFSVRRLPDELVSQTGLVSPFLQLSVKDTGPGIAEGHLPHIFDRFYSPPRSPRRKAIANEGSSRRALPGNPPPLGGLGGAGGLAGTGVGIGLALTRELVHLLGGEIEVKSRVNKGTEFIASLPVTRRAPLAEEAATVEGPWMAGAEELPPITGNANEPEDYPLALIVEDNEDILRYICSCLEREYRIETADNGRKGIEKALHSIPDIIITDVMMPEADGFELCRQLKTDRRTSHIPIILLTAKADEASKLEGLETGADTYLIKPFREEELLVRARKLIELRRQLQAYYSTYRPAATDEEADKENFFMAQFQEVLEERLGEEDFGIVQLCRALGMSRMQLHRKLKALTGQSASHCIRNYRLDRARELLENDELNISEIAYAVGFRSHSYFTESFTKRFGISPKAHQNRQKE
ncbi:MAG: response regulator [Phaeodactylibacter sp.]|nr:response regulator [Phaeodactylibacter sp.]